MKSFKKVLAIVVAMVMVVTTMNLGGAFAATGDLTPDASITITGLDAGDTVNLYKILNWVEGEGWRLTAGYEALTTDGNANFVQSVKDLVDNKSGVSLSKEDLEKIAKVAKAAKTASPAVPAVDIKVVDSDTYTYATTTAPGMYLALVQPGTAGVLYNPIVVSADFKTSPNTSEIDASSAVMGTSAVAKKTKDTVLKTEPDITNNIGGVYHFTVKTTVPLYSDSFENTYFKVSDTVSEYLDIDSSTIKINNTSVTVPSTASATAPAVTVSDDKHSLTINYNDAFIKDQATPTEITITYDAKLNISADAAALLDNVHEEYNEVSIEFPNNPNDDTGKTAVKDGTREYTFTIDGNLLGHTDWRTTEWVKVGRDADGNPIESMVDYKSGESHPALDGALFGLYTTKEAADAATATSYTTGLYKNDVFEGTVETKDSGLLNIPGLNAGTYWLKELTAPKGYIKDQKSHKIEIIADLDTDPGEEVTEWYTVVNGEVVWSKTDNSAQGGIPVTYSVPVLRGYTIKIDDVETKTYKSELDGPHTSTSTVIKSSDAELLNTEGVELPSTGGIGTTLFYVIGAILVLGAGILLVTRRRMNVN